MRYVQLMISWLCFMALFMAAALGLEMLEGYNIATSEYYGLRNLGAVFVFLLFVYGLAAYLIAALPLALLDYRLRLNGWVWAALWSVLGALGGYTLFHNSYAHWTDRGYELNVLTAVLLFGAAGLLYGLLWRMLQLRASRADGR